MAKIEYIEIAGKEYPMSFSLGASKKIAKKFGSVEKMGDLLARSEEVTEQTIDSLVFVLELLICQGCAYKNFFEADMPKSPKAPIDDAGKYVPLATEQLEVACGVMDMKAIIGAIAKAVGKSSETETQIKPKDEKNAEATPA